MKEFNPRALLEHLIVGKKYVLLLWIVHPALIEKFSVSAVCDLGRKDTRTQESGCLFG